MMSKDFLKISWKDFNLNLIKLTVMFISPKLLAFLVDKIGNKFGIISSWSKNLFNSLS